MKNIKINDERLLAGMTMPYCDESGALLFASSDGAGILIPEMISCSERYLSFYIEALTDHSVVLALCVYVKGEPDEPAFYVRFGILPGVRTPVCIDRNWMDGHILYPESNAGQLKQVCHGRRVMPDEIEKIVLEMLPVFHDIEIRLSDMTLTDEYPVFDELPDMKLIDSLGQNKLKEWPSKVRDLGALKVSIEKMEAENKEGYPFDDWSCYGGWKKKKLSEGSGYFSSCKKDGRWYLADPEGYAFFSMGPDCVGLHADCRIDGIEKWLDWLPDRNDSKYSGMFSEMEDRDNEREARRKGLTFSYPEANLYRALGDDWYERWQTLITGQLRHYGMNTLGNWSDQRLFGITKMPYVTSLPEFPSTRQMIFRDFPDVLSSEYEENAKRCARALEFRKGDPFMIGYFLRNEPSWAFVNNLIIADEVLYQPERTACREALIEFLKEKYKDIDQLNKAYNCRMNSFDDFYRPLQKVSSWSAKAKKDMKEFSAKLIRAYIEIPCRACRSVDPNHMILGMRWAWISDPDLVTGWENFDVFSINCYATDPTESLENVARLGVDLPVMIGEFHFGALDAGLSATGLEGVASQKDRGLAYRYYCERTAANPNGVGCHYFQCYDQFALGRFDGENYNIGLFDVCSQPYPEMMESVYRCSKTIYDVMEQNIAPTEEKAVSIPMIAY